MQVALFVAQQDQPALQPFLFTSRQNARNTWDARHQKRTSHQRLDERSGIDRRTNLLYFGI